MTEQMKQALEEASETYVEGVNCYLNNLWHDAKEERPENDLHFLLLKTIFGDYYLEYYGRAKENWNRFAKWAYLEDLFQ